MTVYSICLENIDCCQLFQTLACELTRLLFLLRKTPSPLPATPCASNVLSTLDWHRLEQAGGQVELPRWHPSGQSSTGSRQPSDSSGSADVQLIPCKKIILKNTCKKNYFKKHLQEKYFKKTPAG